MAQSSTPFDLRSTEEDMYSSCNQATVAQYRKDNL